MSEPLKALHEAVMVVFGGMAGGVAYKAFDLGDVSTLVIFGVLALFVFLPAWGVHLLRAHEAA